MTRFIGYPVCDVIEEGLAGAVHTAEGEVMAGLDRLKTLEQKLLLWLLYTKPLRVNYRHFEKSRAYWAH